MYQILALNGDNQFENINSVSHEFRVAQTNELKAIVTKKMCLLFSQNC